LRFFVFWTCAILICSLLDAVVELFFPKKRKSVTGDIVLITGAAHKLGRATAYEFAKHQSKLVLWDTDKEAIEEIAEECRSLGAVAHAFVVDCKKREEVYRVADQVKRDIGDVSILINNTEVRKIAVLMSTKDELIQDMFEANVLSYCWTIKAFLPAMMANDHGHIVTAASINGYVGIPLMATFSSSKFGAVGLHEGLDQELRILGMNKIKTTCLCPTFMKSDLPNNLRLKEFILVEAEDTAKVLMEGILTDQKMIFFPWWIKFIPILK
uniref:Estradiol 17-beta-dehydrogenase 11 n=1 Tax=Salvator merianae TaxID=96440 RepID=A0A8D0C2M6_SALMN